MHIKIDQIFLIRSSLRVLKHQIKHIKWKQTINIEMVRGVASNQSNNPLVNFFKNSLSM